MSKVETTISVIGAGKMGLPLACRMASLGAKVFACDSNSQVVESINSGTCPFDEPGLDRVLRAAVGQGNLSATSDTESAVASSDVVIVIVPVLLTANKEADLSIITAVSEEIARALKPGTMVSYETTLPVGTTRRFAAILEKSGLKAGEDFDLVFSPERVKSQLVLERLSENPKVVGGVNARSAARAAQFYHLYLGAPVINVGTLEAAELVKLAGMVYRDVNIALANELARYADAAAIDIESVIAAANTDGEAAILSPGIGVGGHCTPVYPYFLTADAARRGVATDLASISRSINDSQPKYVIDQIESRFEKVRGKDVLILGLAFRPQVKESLYSPAFQLRDELTRRGANVFLRDPLYSNDEIEQQGFYPWISKGKAGEIQPPIIILTTAHDAFKQLSLPALAAGGCKVFVDGRNMFSCQQRPGDELIYIGIGLGHNNGASSKQAQSPATRRFIPIIRPTLSTQEAEAASQVIRSGWLMQGPQVEALEREFSQFVNCRHACAVSSGTAALHLALLSVGVGPGDEVITVSHSFIATANAVGYCGAVPVFIDVDPSTFNIDPAQIEQAITDKTRAILCVHQMGMPCDLEAIVSIGRKHKLAVVEDAACAVGSEILCNGAWEKIGPPHGDVACFSFHPRKLLTTGDGGMITTSSLDIDKRCRAMRNHGLAGTSYEQIGFNYRMTDVQAAIGRHQLAKLPGSLSIRRRQAAIYMNAFSDCRAVHLPVQPLWAKSNWQSFCLRLADKDQRDRAMSALSDQGIDTRPGIMCAHREPAYAKTLWRCGNATIEQSGSRSAKLLEQSRISQDTGLILPLFDALSDDEITRISGIINAFLPVTTKQ